MCEYCGCLDVAQIAELTAEHDAVVARIGAARRAVEAGDLSLAAAEARFIAVLLGPHTAVEEEGLFPAMLDEFPGHVHRLRDEHRAVESVLAEAADGVPADPTWPQRLVETLRLLREHILAEQDGVFPAALSVLGPDDWDAVAAVRTRVGGPLVATS